MNCLRILPRIEKSTSNCNNNNNIKNKKNKNNKSLIKKNEAKTRLDANQPSIEMAIVTYSNYPQLTAKTSTKKNRKTQVEPLNNINNDQTIDHGKKLMMSFRTDQKLYQTNFSDSKRNFCVSNRSNNNDKIHVFEEYIEETEFDREWSRSNVRDDENDTNYRQDCDINNKRQSQSWWRPASLKKALTNFLFRFFGWQQRNNDKDDDYYNRCTAVNCKKKQVKKLHHHVHRCAKASFLRDREGYKVNRDSNGNLKTCESLRQTYMNGMLKSRDLESERNLGYKKLRSYRRRTVD